jgi:hypothetical protein
MHTKWQSPEAIKIETQLMNLKDRYEESLQSNFRSLSILTDPNGFTDNIIKLQASIPDDHEMQKIIKKLLVDHIDLIRQVTYTGRCLNGALNPFGSIHTDQRLRKQKVNA